MTHRELLLRALRNPFRSGLSIAAITDAIMHLDAAQGAKGDHAVLQARIKDLENRLALVESVTNIQRTPAAPRRLV